MRKILFLSTLIILPLVLTGCAYAPAPVSAEPKNVVREIILGTDPWTGEHAGVLTGGNVYLLGNDSLTVVNKSGLQTTVDVRVEYMKGKTLAVREGSVTLGVLKEYTETCAYSSTWKLVAHGSVVTVSCGDGSGAGQRVVAPEE